MASTLLRTPALPAESATLRPRFQPILDEDTNAISATDFEDIMMGESSNSMGHEYDTPIDNNAILCREIELLRFRHLEEEFEGADDETIPQFAQEIRDNSKPLRV
ncbi:hypothetical protein B0H10DRAFT_1945002 [Mycena sp. CBHHK59/15]|nr:hypothetical protein B0H10DRAFT_1945002 [Mycena sp. CBHHK59/15]